MKTRLYLLIIAVIIGCARNEAPPPAIDAAGTNSESNIQAGESTPMAKDWPFREAKNAAVITLRRILDGTKPILYVVHDDDGSWQFLDGDVASEADASVVSLQNITELDPSIHSLADLPAGWSAERAAVDQPWQRMKH